MSVIFGIDPGSIYTGFGVVRIESRQSVFVDGGRICSGTGAFSVRLGRIYKGLTALLAKHLPDAVALEEVFMAKNPSSALKLGQARGVCVLAVANVQVPLYEFSTRYVKKNLTGTGGAQKAQMQYMVSKLLQLRHCPSEDEADALALAYVLANGYANSLNLEQSML